MLILLVQASPVLPVRAQAHSVQQGQVATF
jgi:hypothetical protein